MTANNINNNIIVNIGDILLKYSKPSQRIWESSDFITSIGNFGTVQ